MDSYPVGSLTIGLRAFLNRVNDAIVDNVVSTTPSQTRSVNAGRASSRGIELMAEQTVSDALHWFCNLTYTRTELHNVYDPDQDGARIPFAPDYVANLGITVSLPLGVTVSPYLTAVGTYYDSSSRSGRRVFGRHELLNMKIQASLVRRSRYALSAAMELNNLTNRRFEMPFQFRDPGFNCLGSLQLSF